MSASHVAGWNERLLDQLMFHWTIHLRPKLEGLSDDEYFWEPVPSCWSVRRREAATTSIVMGVGLFVVEVERSRPEPPPVTTIAWRMVHIIVDCLGTRSETQFGGPAINWQQYEVPGTADWALRDLDAAVGIWTAGVRSLGAEGLERPSGPTEGPFADQSVAGLVLHIHREVIHHGAEILLLRDLYRSRESTV